MYKLTQEKYPKEIADKAGREFLRSIQQPPHKRIFNWLMRHIYSIGLIIASPFILHYTTPYIQGIIDSWSK